MLFWHDLFFYYYRCMNWYMHDIMNDIVMNNATYNSCYFDMNCMLLFFFLTLIDTRWWCSKWRIVPSYNSCYFHMNYLVMVTLIDTSVWYYELHCCEYYHIQLTLLWHELYFCWCNELLEPSSYNSCLFYINCMVWYQSVLYCFIICLCCHKLCL